MEHSMDMLKRRDFLKKMLAAGIVGAVGSSLPARQVLAMGQGGQLQEGIRKVQGPVMVNGAPAQVGSLVFPGDTVTTGSAGFGVFVIGRDAFLVRENSRVELAGDKEGTEPGATKIVRSLTLAAGKMLAVFGSGGKRLETQTAVAGTRGTGIYIESDQDMTYVCLCYGGLDLDAKAFPGARESFTSRHHENAYYVLGTGAKRAFLKAPRLNHTDEELVMLEALVGRKPPFAGSPLSSRASGY